MRWIFLLLAIVVFPSCTLVQQSPPPSPSRPQPTWIARETNPCMSDRGVEIVGQGQSRSLSLGLQMARLRATTAFARVVADPVVTREVERTRERFEVRVSGLMKRQQWIQEEESIFITYVFLVLPRDLFNLYTSDQVQRLEELSDCPL